MKILVAKSAGFCFGVKRAINIATECAARRPIQTLGPIIHNPQVVKKLEETAGIRPKGTVSEMGEGTIIIRSHGVRLEELEGAKGKGLTIVDATCPFVKKTQALVSELTGDGYTVVVVGEKEHPEVKGIVSYGSKGVIVATGPEELENLPPGKKIAVVAQTTQSVENLKRVVNFCVEKAQELKVFNTICNATTIRQIEAVEIAQHSDCVLVVGGKNSANTTRLAEICRGIQKRTHHIEVAEEIEDGWFEGVDTLGVTAGASTPEWIIKEVIKRVEGL